MYFMGRTCFCAVLCWYKKSQIIRRNKYKIVDINILRVLSNIKKGGSVMRKITEEDRVKINRFKSNGEEFSKTWCSYGKAKMVLSLTATAIIALFFLIYFLT